MLTPLPLVLAGWRGFCADIAAAAPPTWTLRPTPDPRPRCTGGGCPAVATLGLVGTPTRVCPTCAAQCVAAAQRAGHPAPRFTPWG